MLEARDGMDDWTASELTSAEKELLIDFVEWAGEFDRQILDRQTVNGNPDKIGLQEAFEFLVPIISEEASEFDAQMFRFFRLEREVKSRPTFEYKKRDELPEDAKITPEEINRFLRKDELEEFFTLAGQMIEDLTVKLVIDEVIAPPRRSESVRGSVAQKSQREREWLLFVTGAISDGEKGEIRRTYNLRSSIVHSSDDDNGFLNEVNIPSDITRAKNAVYTLHEKLHGIELHHRFGDLIS